jgi:para-nitrobenzyl esterase
MYRFDWRTPCFGGDYSPHAAEVPFVFGTLDYKKAAFGSLDTPRRRARADPEGHRYHLAATLQKAWAAFARTGNPSNHLMPAWPEYALPERSTMIFDRECVVRRNPTAERRGIVARLDVARRALALAT